MSDLSTKRAYAIAAAGGAALWVVTAMVSGEREAWDASLYWTIAYPLAIALAGTLGYQAPRRPWRWALVVMLVQAVVLAVGASEFGMLPLVVVALIMAAVRRRRGGRAG